jgi:broad specificity phosphatase PhoE
MTTACATPITLSSANGTTATLVTAGDALPPIDPGATDVILVRHGETDWNRDGRCQGLAEVSLNAVGVAQIERVGEMLSAAEIDAAYTSPLTRARESAHIILASTGLSPMRTPPLREIDYGRLTGLAPMAWHTVDATLDERWREAPWDVAFPGGESLTAVSQRVTPVWDQLVAMHRGERVLLVGHGHVHRVLLLHSTGVDRRRFWTIPQPNAAVWHVRIPATSAASTPDTNVDA